MHRGVGADDVVVGQDVGESELFHALGVSAEDGGISPELGLRERDSKTHSQCNRAAPQLLPAK
ncbi:Uncharacterised protein [Mycobacterium tuberculosis]|nr:Uncharacterised protein [Mycobacterium tuberculosis]